MRKSPSWLYVLFGALIFSSVFAVAEDLGPSIAAQHENKVVMLRGFWADDQLQYDSAGQVMGSPKAGRWTTDGIVLIDKITLSPSQVDLHCKRMVLARVKWVHWHEPVTLDYVEGLRSVDIVVHLGSPVTSAEGFVSVLSRLFFTNQDHLIEKVPDYWKPCIRAGLSDLNSDAGTKCEFSPRLRVLLGNAIPSSEVGSSASPVSNQGPVDRRDFTPPRPVGFIRAERTVEGRQAKIYSRVALQLTVDVSGRATDIRIIRPMGYGIDENLIEAVEKAKFEPAREHGKPVPCPMEFQYEF